MKSRQINKRPCGSTDPVYARSERVVSWPSARLLDSHVAKVEAMEER